MNNTSLKFSIWQRSFVVRCFRWFFRWRTLRFLAFGIFCLVTLALLVLAEENWRGRRAWEKFRREWEAKGERFDLASIIPKPVPPDQNFAMTPLLAPLLDYDYAGGALRWRDSNAVAYARSITVGGAGSGGKEPSSGNWQRGQFCYLAVWQTFYRGNTNFASNPEPKDPARDVLFALQKYDPVFAELRAASQRPYAVYPIHYDETIFALLPQLGVLKSVAGVVELRALANLEAGQNEEALADLKLALHLAATLKSEPLLISQLVRISIVHISLQPAWEGLARHQWTEAQLAEVQAMMAAINLLEDYGLAIRGERAFGNEMMSLYREGRFPGTKTPESNQTLKLPRWLMPSGFFYQNQLVMSRLHQEFSLPVVDAAHHRVYPDKSGTNVVASVLKRRTPYNIFAWMLFPAVEKVGLRFARAQAALDEATVGCALERYRLANGRYPDAIDALAPRFIDKLPPDVINGQPLNYRRTDDGRFVLYSVGWNQTDDGGVVSLTKGSTPSVDPSAGDWVWQYPSK